jgi:hypothetical protein
MKQETRGLRGNAVHPPAFLFGGVIRSVESQVLTCISFSRQSLLCCFCLSRRSCCVTLDGQAMGDCVGEMDTKQHRTCSLQDPEIPRLFFVPRSGWL